MRGRVGWRVIWLILVAAGFVVAALPFLWTLVSSFVPFKHSGLGFSFEWSPAYLSPSHWTLDNYRTVWKYAGLSRYALNTVIYAGAAAVITTFVASLAAYAFARLRFPGKNFLFGLTLATMMIPSAVTMIPLFILMLHIPLAGGNNLIGFGGHGLYNTYAGLILPGAVSVASIFLLRQFFKTLPRDLEDAARIDGASELGIWFRVILPLSKPGLITVALLQFQGYWNAYLWPLVISGSDRMYTLQVGLQAMQSYYQMGQGAPGFVGPDFAGTVITVFPILLLFVLGQKYFVRGITLTGLK